MIYLRNTFVSKRRAYAFIIMRHDELSCIWRPDDIFAHIYLRL